MGIPEEPEDGGSDSEDEYSTVSTPQSGRSSVQERFQRTSKRRIAVSFRSIRRGDMLDVRDDDGMWYLAEVVKKDTYSRRIYVSFSFVDDVWDKWIDVDDRVAPKFTFTYDDNGHFRVGHMVEVSDVSNPSLWHGANIIDVTPTAVRVAYHQQRNRYTDEEWITGPRNRIRSYRRNTSHNSRQIANAMSHRLWKIPPGAAGATAAVGGTSTSSSSQARLSHHDSLDSKPSAIGYVDDPQTPPSTSTYHSEDSQRRRQIAHLSERYLQYLQALQRQGLHIFPVQGDGNCLFRAVAHQVYGDEGLHYLVRRYCMDYMEAEGAFFSQFVEGGEHSFRFYVSAKRRDGCWGDDPEIQAICEIYNRPAEIFAYDAQTGARKLRTFHEGPLTSVAGEEEERRARSGQATSSRSSIVLSYYGGGHYDSIMHERAFALGILRESPGEVEQRALQLCKLRNAAAEEQQQRPGQQLEQHLLDEAKVSSDVETTDQQQVQQVILSSQLDNSFRTGWAREDLDACLKLAMALDRDEAKEKLERHMNASNGCEAKVSSDQTPSKCRKAGGEDRSNKMFDMVEDLAEAQRQELLSVQQQSEQEYLEEQYRKMTGMISSTGTQSEEEALRQAKLASLQVPVHTAGGLSEEEQLSLALKMSAETSAEDEVLQQVLKTSAEDSTSLMLGDYDEDSLLQAALEESIQVHSNSAFDVVDASSSISMSTSLASGSHQPVAGGSVANEEEFEELDEDLMLAIQASLAK